MLDYAANETVCRSRMLLRYFGEKNEHNCGLCDTCLTLRNKQKNPTPSPKSIRTAIIQTLKSTPNLTPAQVAGTVATDKDIVAGILRDLMDERILTCENGLLKMQEVTK